MVSTFVLTYKTDKNCTESKLDESGSNDVGRKPPNVRQLGTVYSSSRNVPSSVSIRLWVVVVTARCLSECGITVPRFGYDSTHGV